VTWARLDELLSDAEPPLVLEIGASRKSTPAERTLLEAPWELLWSDGFLASDIGVGYVPLRRIGERGDSRAPQPGALSVLFMAASTVGFAAIHPSS
jgi:hypothetical protein